MMPAFSPAQGIVLGAPSLSAGVGGGGGGVLRVCLAASFPVEGDALSVAHPCTFVLADPWGQVHTERSGESGRRARLHPRAGPCSPAPANKEAGKRTRWGTAEIHTFCLQETLRERQVHVQRERQSFLLFAPQADTWDRLTNSQWLLEKSAVLVTPPPGLFPGGALLHACARRGPGGAGRVTSSPLWWPLRASPWPNTVDASKPLSLRNSL